MFCKNCGTQLSDSAKFCGSCGQAVAKAAPSSTKQKLSLEKSKKYLLILVVLVIAVVLICSLTGGSGPEKTAQQFVEAMLSGDGSACVALLTDDAVEKTGAATRKVLINTMDDALDGMIEEYKDRYGDRWTYKISVVDSYEYTYEYYDGSYIGDAITVVLEIEHSGKGLFNDKVGSETETVIVIKDGGKWRIVGFGS